jgi:two-component system chemotaxis sensor kinase CheA
MMAEGMVFHLLGRPRPLPVEVRRGGGALKIRGPRPDLREEAMTWHTLVRRQLQQAFPGGVPDLAELETLIAQVSQAYAAADAARSELEGRVAQLTALEQIMVERTTELDQRSRNMAVLLDNVAQGLAMVGLDGALRADCSRAFAQWFDAPNSGVAIWDVLAGDDPNLAAWIQLGFESLHSELMPTDVVLGQLPHRIKRNGRQLRVEYQPIGVPLAAVLIVVSDVTDEIARQRAEAVQRELVAVVDTAYRDRSGFVGFIRETNELLRDSPAGMPLAELKRRVHTLKGNAAMFGVSSVAELCHEIENRIDAEGVAPDGDAWAALLDTWHQFHDRVDDLLKVSQRRSILVDWDEYQSVLGSIGDDEPSWVAQIRRWSQDPTLPHLEHFADRAQQLARRLGKAELDIELVDNDLRVDGERVAPLWSALVHCVRNAVDHGIESTELRLARGKPARARMVFTSELRGGELVIEVRDDGSGIDWDTVARRAAAMGLPTRTRRDLVDALFASGLSTASQITQTSGRGLGMSALRAACSELGGRVELVSEPGHGTTVRCCVPLARSPTRAHRTSMIRV